MKNPLVEIFIDIIYNGLEKFGKYYSTYRAWVIDNDDPQKLQKLKLIIPGIRNNPSDKWVPPCNVFYGINWGSQCIPPKGALVWVEFEKGDPNYPIWRHGYPGTDDTRVTPDRLKSVNNFWFMTPQGSIVEMNDDLGTITVTDARGNIVQTSAKGISMKPLGKGQIFQGDIDKADNPATLGNPAQDILDRHNDQLTSINASIQNLSSQFKSSFEVMALAISPILAAGALLVEAPKVVKTATTEVNNATTRDNTISGIKNDIPKIKSKTVLTQS